MKDLKLNEVPEHITKAAVQASGITEDVDDIVLDFKTDTYWNDPKCAGRRIRRCGGDHLDFF